MSIQKVMVTTDLSDESYRAVPLALEICERFGAELILLSVVEEPYYVSSLDAGASVLQILKQAVPEVQARLDERLAELELDAPRRALVVQAASAAPAIVEAARQEGADLIVMATHGRSGLSHLLIGSTAEKVLRSSPVPVLTIRAS